MCKEFPSKKPATREIWDKLSVYFSIFEWYNWPKYQFSLIAKCQMPFFGIIVNFIIEKFSLSQFSLLTGFFERTRENILHIFRALKSSEFVKMNNKLVHWQEPNVSKDLSRTWYLFFMPHSHFYIWQEF